MKPVRIAAAILIAVLVIYPLSIGPVCALDMKLRMTLDMVESDYVCPSRICIICYYPILRLMDKSPAIRSMAEEYIRFWFR